MWRKRKHDDFQAEIDAHLQIEADRLRESGLSPSDAEAAARRTFGNATLTLERFYESSRWQWWDHLKQDVRYGFRSMARAPLLTSTILGTLALGIGASALVFSVLRAVVLRPLPYDQPHRLVQLWDSAVRPGGDWVAFANFRDWENENRVFSQMAAYRYSLLTVAGGAPEPDSVLGLEVTDRLFDLLGSEPMRGRTFLPGEDRPGREAVAVISHALWQRRWSGSDATAGRAVTIDGLSYTIVGVMPPSFGFPDTLPGQRIIPVDLWIPMRKTPDLEERDSLNYWAIGRLNDGASLQTADANLNSIAASLEQRFPDTNRNRRVRMESLKDHLNRGARGILFILMAGVGSLLAIACANIASLLLSRAEARRGEVAIRQALGASRGRLVRQALTESMLFAVIGGSAGLALAHFGTRLAIDLAPANIPRIGQTAVDLQVLVFSTAVAVLTGILFGLAPALSDRRGHTLQSLAEAGTRGSSGAASLSMRRLLVGCQVALAVMMLTSAGLLLRSFLNVVRLDPGFRKDRIVTGYLNLQLPKYGDPQQQAGFFEEALTRIRTLPGVASAAVSNSVPLTEINDSGSVLIEGRTDQRAGEMPPSANRPHVSAGYFETMGIPLVQGRTFDTRDGAAALPVAIVSEVAAARFWPNENAIGKRLSIESIQGKRLWREVVGVVHTTRHFGLEANPRPEVYVPHAQSPSSFMIVVVRVHGDDADILRAMRREIAAIDSQQAVMQGGSLEQLVSDAQAKRRLQSTVLAALAVLAVLLAALGIYGVTAHSVTRRRREIGTRLALGARPRDVVLMIAKTGSRAIVIGTLAGLAGAVALSKVLASFMFGISALDSATFAGVALLLTLVAGLALYPSSRRAATVDPVIVLREA
jgi:predicted permease